MSNLVGARDARKAYEEWYNKNGFMFWAEPMVAAALHSISAGSELPLPDGDLWDLHELLRRHSLWVGFALEGGSALPCYGELPARTYRLVEAALQTGVEPGAVQGLRFLPASLQRLELTQGLQAAAHRAASFVAEQLPRAFRFSWMGDEERHAVAQRLADETLGLVEAILPLVTDEELGERLQQTRSALLERA